MRPPKPHHPKQDLEQLYIFGAGGSGREVAWLATRVLGERIGITFVVDDPRYLGPSVHGYDIVLLSDLDPAPDSRFVAAIGDPEDRRRAVRACRAAGLTPFSLIHPAVERSPYASVGEGSIIAAASVLTTDVEVGKHVHINVGCSISHDSRIGDFATLSPGVKITGNVHVGEGAFIGAGAVISNGVSGNPMVIGAGATVAAGACVISPVAPHSMVAGVPAVRKK